ncbi:YdcF family protein [Rhodohalobacter sp. 8-1]|uniref:YdcF family protein n=1 Tax=Rhodohalobacter sp. 8-1 TaxID=3131972 RepID=UPI0030ED2FC6
MTSVIKFLLDPFNILWFMVAAGLVCRLVNYRKSARYLFIGTGVLFLVVTTPFVPIKLLDSLERQYEPIYADQLSDRDASYHIVVLGQGHGYDDRLPANSLLSSGALGRLAEGIRLHRQLSSSTLILSGFSSSGRKPQAEMLRDAALLLGVDKESTRMQTEPGNTLEEAMVYAERFSGEEKVILVTSAAHMPRSVMLFERAGIEVIPSPTNYRLKGSWRNVWFGMPSMDNIEKLRSAIYEYAAILKYKIV